MKVQYYHWRVPEGTLLKERGQPSELELERYYRTSPNFVPSPTGGATRCHIIMESGAEFEGTAYCSRGDIFSYAEGRKWAEERAIAAILDAVDGATEVGYAGKGVTLDMPRLSADYIGKAIKLCLDNTALSRVFRMKLRGVLQDVEFFEVSD